MLWQTVALIEGKCSAAEKLGQIMCWILILLHDLTIMEEASELVERITKGENRCHSLPSCCPAWVKFAETYYPEMLPHISSAKSPIGMQGPTIKTYFAKKWDLIPEK
mgnify:CR=1 FL=1